jgi:hypothetical protein
MPPHNKKRLYIINYVCQPFMIKPGFHRNVPADNLYN